MKRILFVVVLLLVIAVSAQAADVSVAAAVPIQKDSSEVKAVANPQFALRYKEQTFWMWDCLMGEYPKNIPTGLGIIVRVFPSVDTSMQGLLGLYVCPHELNDTVLDLSKGQVVKCQQTPEGRWYADIEIDKYATEPLNIAFYALVKGAKRSEWFFLIPIRQLTFVNKANASQSVGSLRITTSPWAWSDPDNPLSIAKMMRRAGVGGSGLVYDQIADADYEAVEAQKAAEAARKAETTRAIDQATTAIAGAQVVPAVTEPAKTTTTVTFWPKFKVTAERTIILTNSSGAEQRLRICADKVPVELMPGTYRLRVVDGEYSSKTFTLEISGMTKDYDLESGGK